MTELKYDRKIRRFRSRLKIYRPDSILPHVLSHLHHSQNNVNPTSGMPWVVLLFLKMCMQECTGVKRDMSKGEFASYVNELFGLQHLASTIELGGFELKIRAMIQQQAWYQIEPVQDVKALVRQMIWYCSSNPIYSSKFKEVYGLSLENFYTISLFLLMAVVNGAKGVVVVNVHSLVYWLTPKIPSRDIFSYFAIVSVRSEDLPSFFSNHVVLGEDGLHQQSEYVQTSPMRKKPIILDGENLCVYFASLFSRSIRLLVPSLLKEQKTWQFKNYFGPDMEMYVGALLQKSNVEYHAEHVLNKICKAAGIPDGKMADYLALGKVNVVFESKAIEPGDVVTAVSDSSILCKTLGGSFIKGIEQCQETVYRLRQVKDFSESKFLSVVITHEDFWFSSAADIVRNVDVELEGRVINKYGQLPSLFEDILFITIEDLESILQAASLSKIVLGDFLVECSSKLQEPSGKRFTSSHMIQEMLAGVASGHFFLSERVEDWYSGFSTDLEQSMLFWRGKAHQLMRHRQAVIGSLHRHFDEIHKS